MLTISKPLSAGQLRTYHAEEFANARANYYSTEERIAGHWHGRLAEEWGLVGAVEEEHVHRLADGRHPLTNEELVRHQTSRAYTNEHGEQVRTMEHRAGWDLTFSAPKSVSLTALVGGDTRVLAAHRASVETALDETERYVQSRIGRSHPAETTGKWIAARFEHDSARPVDGYAAPQVHTHAVVFNVTERANGDPRALQPRELYRTQQYATAIYRSELARRLVTLGYDIERGSSGQPEIAGYSADYLDASSPRRQQIEEALAREQRSGAGAAQIAAHRTRQPKLDASHADMQQRHRDLARRFGDQPARAVEAAENALARGDQHVPYVTPYSAVTYARDRSFERDAVVDDRALMREALNRSMGDLSLQDVREELKGRTEAQEFVAVTRPPGTPGEAFTTREMIALEHATIERMVAGRATPSALATPDTRDAIDRQYPHLSASQREAVDQILANRDRVQALEGVAGAGKTTALVAVRDAAEREGYRVEGLAPTSRAAQKLAESGIPSGTLQRHLVEHEAGSRHATGHQHDASPHRHTTPDPGARHLYVLDESSLTSTRQMHAFLDRLQPHDRVLLVGDVRQHQAVEAGRPYQQLQEAGLATARLDDIIRQKEPGLKHVVEQLSRGEIAPAVRELEDQGRVHQLPDRSQRFGEIARDYLRSPHHTLVVSPDNESRAELNQAIHRAMQDVGHVDRREHTLRVLVARQDVTGPDRQWAAQYETGNVVRYTSGSAALGVNAGEYVRVAHVSAQENLVTVTRRDGSHVAYDPRHLYGVTLYREAERAFSAGDRIQFTAPLRALHVANRELGSVERVAPTGTLTVRLDSGRSITFEPSGYPHLDHGYAVTSHSSQGQTADRVLVHIDTQQRESLVNRRFAYVAVSRAREDVQIYTNDQTRLVASLGREYSHSSAITQTPALARGSEVSQARALAETQGLAVTQGLAAAVTSQPTTTPVAIGNTPQLGQAQKPTQSQGLER